MEKLKILTLTLLILFVVASCNMAPQKQMIKPAYDVPESFETVNRIIKQDSVLQSRWWYNFKDDSLNRLIERVIANNLDIRVTMGHLKQMEANFKQARSQRLPAVGISADNTASKRAMFFGDKQLDIDNIQYSISGSLSFELDIWGRLNHLENAAIADLMSSKHDLKTLYLAITAQAINSYYNIKASEWQIRITQKLLLNYEEDLMLEEMRYENGIGALLNVALTRQALAGVQAQILLEKQQLYFFQHQLAILSGTYPQSDSSALSEEERVNQLPTYAIAVSIPSTLLKRRNDIISAEYKLESARQRIGAARADFFPRISLTSSLGFLSQDLADLFKDDYMTTSYGGALQGTYPIGGKSANLKLNWSIYEQAEYNYRKTVLTAFKEVEDALVQFETATGRLLPVREQLEASLQAMELREEQYIKGVGDYDRLLESKLSYFRTRYNLVSAYKDIYLSRLALHQALGGGFNEEE